MKTTSSQKTMKNTSLIFFAILLLIFILPKTILAEFHNLQDIAYWEDDIFKTKVTDSSGGEYLITRKVLSKAKYDGPPGKTAMTITKEDSNVFHEEIKGQFKLFGFSSDNLELYAFHIGQQGAEFRILNIVVFNQSHPQGKVLGPNGGFQYGSPSPNGNYCLLLDYRVFVVSLLTGKWEQIQTDYKFNNTEADPTREGKYGGTNIGGSANLTGDFLEMVWQKPTSGTLNIKSIKKNIPIYIHVQGQTYTIK